MSASDVFCGHGVKLFDGADCGVAFEIIDIIADDMLKLYSNSRLNSYWLLP